LASPHRPTNDTRNLDAAVRALQQARRVVAFTGAGISVESGIPPFRGVGGLWSKYDPECLDIDYFNAHATEAWLVIKEIFYDFFGKAKPNPAHFALAQMEAQGRLGCIITQNIDALHQQAGSRAVIEFHGTSRRLVCMRCKRVLDYSPSLLEGMPPRCACGGILKPDFVFFGEPIPQAAHEASYAETFRSDTWLVIGTTGEVQPASWLPHQAKRQGATIVEINVEASTYTNAITDIFLSGKASEILPALVCGETPG